MNPRQQLKQELIDCSDRRIVTDGNIYICEGQGFLPHECKGGIEMNEVLFTRNHIKHLTPSKQAYFWDKINCSLVCTWFHRKSGHTRPFKDWWIRRVGNLYGIGRVLEWTEEAPVRIRR